MSGRARVSIALALGILCVVGLLAQDDERIFTGTSYGQVPYGFGVFHDWLEALGLPAARGYAVAPSVAEARSVWFLAPDLPCPAEEDAGAEASA